MNNHDDHALRLRLGGLRRDVEPRNDLWPAIAQRIESDRQSPLAGAVPAPGSRQQAVSLRRGARLRRLLPLAVAASLLLAIGFTWRMRIGPDDPSPLIHEHAVAMSRDYRAALAQLEQAPLRPEIQPALEDLDHSVAQILGAIETHPDAVFLLDQLQRTYARRLELTQRAIIT
ncbi:MAG TPA: hypothetical protein VK439_16080 [Rubrivivax sp.]|nr:hypothetical protein [Rubrivivax sp.]